MFWRVFKYALNLIWFADILNLNDMKFLDTTIPINTVWWIIIWATVYFADQVAKENIK